MLGMLITSRKKATLWFSFDQTYATRAGSRNLLAQKPPMLGTREPHFCHLAKLDVCKIQSVLFAPAFLSDSGI